MHNWALDDWMVARLAWSVVRLARPVRPVFGGGAISDE